MDEKSESHGIEIHVKSIYVPERSNPREEEYFFSYRIRIQNNGLRAVQLINRHWIITDGLGRVEEIRGPGVIGQQPRLEPGESFEYESFCPLATPTGTMRGSYEMKYDTGDVADGHAADEQFEAQIPPFFLVEPSSFH